MTNEKYELAQLYKGDIEHIAKILQAMDNNSEEAHEVPVEHQLQHRMLALAVQGVKHPEVFTIMTDACDDAEEALKAKLVKLEQKFAEL